MVAAEKTKHTLVFPNHLAWLYEFIFNLSNIPWRDTGLCFTSDIVIRLSLRKIKILLEKQTNIAFKDLKQRLDSSSKLFSNEGCKEFLLFFCEEKKK